MRRWQHAAVNETLCAAFRHGWPGEQGCLHALLSDLSAKARQKISVQDMHLLNGPWGKFIRHFFGEQWWHEKFGEAWLSREQPGGGISLAVQDELHKHNVWGQSDYTKAMNRVERSSFTFGC